MVQKLQKYTCRVGVDGRVDGTDSDNRASLNSTGTELPTGTELGSNININNNDQNTNNNNKKLGPNRILDWLTKYMNRPKYTNIQ